MLLLLKLSTILRLAGFLLRKSVSTRNDYIATKMLHKSNTVWEVTYSHEVVEMQMMSEDHE